MVYCLWDFLQLSGHLQFLTFDSNFKSRESGVCAL